MALQVPVSQQYTRAHTRGLHTAERKITRLPVPVIKLLLFVKLQA
jgi:hypothetical protein